MAFMRTFDAKFFGFLVFFSLLMAMLIYARETWDNYQVSLSAVVAWQLAIWMPWFGGLRVLGHATRQLKRRAVATAILVGAGLLTFHFLWFFWLSASFSPLLLLPHTGYGVYPYFFIFFSMIDLAMLWGVMTRVGIFQLLEAPPAKGVEDIITVKKGSNQIVLPVDTIRWVAAEDYYARIYSSKGEYLIRQPLKVLLDRLPAGEFVQIHRSTAVRVNFVEETQANGVLLKDGSERRMSRAGAKRLSGFLS
jgi:hypothetical protein